MNKKEFLRKRKEVRKKYMALKIVVPLCCLLLMGVIGLLIPLRPKVSSVEKRNLTTFPEFSVGDFLDGTYTTNIGLWYADTFPMRDQMIAGNEFVTSCYGLKQQQIYGDMKKGDAIPDLDSVESVSTDTPQTDAPQTDAAQTDASSETEPQTTAPETEPETKQKETEPLKDGTIHEEGETFGTVYVADNRAFSVYYFNQTAADTYAQAISSCSAILKEQGVTVYDILAPTSIGVNLDDAIQEELYSSNQGQAFEYIGKKMTDGVQFVNPYETMRAHNSEYLYFGTDHHWTALGAYYAYTEFAEKKGITPHSLDYFEKKEFPGFLGTFYASSNQAEELASNPDTVVAYVPKGTNDMTYTSYDGLEYQWNVISDATEYDENSKYMCFIGGDQPYEEIHNPTITDGSACVVIKESYGNAFVPFLVDHYQDVYVVDYRYYTGSLSYLVISKGIQDVIFLNNAEALSSDDVVSKIYNVAVS
ncbi:MAG: hypothetical protein KHY79_06960 [Clostridiales bacterium]|nr:hypothetical protein [Clostridiales bacterium]